LSRPLLVGLTAIGCMLAVLSPPKAQARHVDRSRLNVMHLNIAGATRHEGRTGIADRLADSVADRAPGLPLAVSVNEVCFQQWNRLHSRLVALGYTGHFGPSLFSTARCGNQPFGNAIFWLGGHAEAQTFPIPDEHQINGAGTAEKRNMVCGRANFPERTWYCSTHLVNGNTTVAGRQADNIRAIANLLNTNHRAIIMGDFNLRPGDAAMTRWFGGFWLDADECRCRKTHSGGSKIDYILVRADRFSFGHDAFITDQVDSDHSLMQGYPVFK
ncbi:MAG TPA: endonuclease/exonuclease/phosphatase family protein, partial [Archangium sp.]